MEKPSLYQFDTENGEPDGEKIQLGAGMSGVTYKGNVHRNGENIPAALKCFNGRIIDDATYTAIKREAILLKQLSHDCTARYLGFFPGKRDPIIATEFVEGKTMDYHIARRGSNPSDEDYLVDVARWAAMLADALEHLEGLGIVHRDLKPENILIRQQKPSTPVIIDFGIGKTLDTANLAYSNTTIAGTFTGNLDFSAPEQFCLGEECQFCEVEPCKVTSKTDIYSLGAVIWYALTGTPPVEIPARRDLSFQKKMGIAKRETKIDVEALPDLPRLRTILEAMLSVSPANRPSPGEVYEAFRNIHDEKSRLPLQDPTYRNVQFVRSEIGELPHFVANGEQTEIADSLIDYDSFHYLGNFLDEIIFDNESKPVRISWILAENFISCLNEEDTEWHYRFATDHEWRRAAGYAKDSDMKPLKRSKFADSSEDLEWCIVDWRKEFAECQFAIYARQEDESIHLCERHELWPKGLLRLVREPKSNAS